MTSRRVLPLLGFLGALAALTFSAAPASADAVTDASTQLQTAAVYLQPGATVKGHDVVVDLDKVDAAFGSGVKVAILADAGSVAANQAAVNNAGNAIERSLGAGRFVLAVFSGNQFAADSNAVTGAADTLKAAVKAHTNDMSAGKYTDALVSFAQQVVKNPSKTGTGSGLGNTGSSTPQSASSDSSGSAVPVLLGIGGVAVVGGGLYAVSRRRKARRTLADARSVVMPYYDRLANEVNTINTLDNTDAQQAMADASERYNSAGSQMATAATVPQWAAVRRTTLEGLQATASARKALGLPAGPEIPPVDEPRGEQLTEAQQVTVQGQQVQGYPSYTPGAPYYYGGGGGYLGGWYSTPFWETLLIGSMIGGGGWGWGGGGGGYDSGYSSGYEAGQSNANDTANDGAGGGWGGFGGGGGGGGEWGGFGGSGGDVGGGGGDFGGGGDGGSF